uniref:Cuticular protein n=1 Tax=Daphnia galeata TaxID=27404 RepID=A0A8J2R9T1_9CRUS|nr:unnamed protein product [Daphnia galeata]
MESYPLMLLSMLVICSLILNQETISVCGRRDDSKVWSNPFEKLVSGRSKFRKSDAKPKKDLEFMVAFHPDGLKHVGHPITTQMNWEDRSSTFSRHKPNKYVDPPVKFTTARPKPNLTDILGNSQRYQDIIFSIDQRPDIKLDGKAPSKDKTAKPFWGPPIETPSTAKPTYYARPTTRTVPFMTKEEKSVYHQSNIWEHSTFDSKIGDHNKRKDPKEKSTSPEHILEYPIHMQSGPPYRQEQDPIDQSFSQSYYHQDHLGAGIVSKDPELFRYITNASSRPSALASYPAPYYPASSPDHHVVYHHPAPAHNNYYHPPSGFTQVDFSPIFLAVVPIALFLGAAAAFTLATATSSSSAAVAVAQQQQQQEESSNNNAANNNNANNNNNAILAALLEVIQNKHDSHRFNNYYSSSYSYYSPPTPTLSPMITAKKVPPFERFENQSVSIPPDKPIFEEDELTDGFDLPGGGTVIEPLILEEEEPEILSYDL